MLARAQARDLVIKLLKEGLLYNPKLGYMRISV